MRTCGADATFGDPVIAVAERARPVNSPVRLDRLPPTTLPPSTSMILTRARSLVTQRAPANYFTGTVWLDELSPPAAASDVRAVMVTFEPGARTAWHTHPHGQWLQIVSGLGRVQKAGESVVSVAPGDVIWFEPGERHWHGAAPDRSLVHLAVQRADASGKAAVWQEHVSDADYTATPVAPGL